MADSAMDGFGTFGGFRRLDIYRVILLPDMACCVDNLFPGSFTFCAGIGGYTDFDAGWLRCDYAFIPCMTGGRDAFFPCGITFCAGVGLQTGLGTG